MLELRYCKTLSAAALVLLLSLLFDGAPTHPSTRVSALLAWWTRQPTRTAVTLGVVLIAAYANWPSMMRYLGSGRGRGRGRGSREARFAARNGGEVGGIANDGNTCFMNLVIQLLASSRQLERFLELYVGGSASAGEAAADAADATAASGADEHVAAAAAAATDATDAAADAARGAAAAATDATAAPIDASTAAPGAITAAPGAITAAPGAITAAPGAVTAASGASGAADTAARPGFSLALKHLLDGVNGAYGTRGREFSTRDLLNHMPNGPKQNFFSGYNQEDAQEFYQLVFGLLEKEYKAATGRAAAASPPLAFVARSDIADFVYGLQEMGRIGTVYVPAAHIDPNLDREAYAPMELVTPVDGVTVERVGCLACGEHGGIRYAVNSGLLLNLPTRLAAIHLTDLLDEWVAPDVIEGVDCNRCGLEQTRELLQQKAAAAGAAAGDKLAAMYAQRIAEIDSVLARAHVADDAFERLTVKQMVKQTRKLKQTLWSRPPPLLLVHINRSVFDARTYQIVKNPANVEFAARLDLAPYTADPDHINTDAREPLRRAPGADRALVYRLQAVISHFGTHNYGHYICYRRLRGSWWRISDESVYVVGEAEVLQSQGTFMLFYEWEDGAEEALEDISSSDSDSDSSDSDAPRRIGEESLADSETEEIERSDASETEAPERDDPGADDFNSEESRAFHI